MQARALIAAAALASAAASAQVDEEALSERVAEIIRPFTLESGSLHGAGAELLIDEGARAGFFVLGERHLRHEIPALSEALLTELRPHGYSALAIETGEGIAELAERSFRDDDGESLAEVLRRQPFTAAFLDHLPEFELLDHAVGLGYELWGLDQVFVGGARFNLTRLRELAPDETARQAAERALQRANEGFEHYARTGDDSSGFLIAAEAGAYADLREAFEGMPQALRIIDELETSGRIYRLYGAGENYASNHLRIQLMKRHLVERFQRSAHETRVFIKVGGIHGVRGYTRLNQLDVGNSAAELGLLRGEGSIHVFVEAIEMVGAQGEVTRTIDADHPLAPIAAAMPESADWVVADLRELRPLFHDGPNAEAYPDLAEWIWGYDLIVLTRRFTRAERVPGVPAPPD